MLLGLLISCRQLFGSDYSTIRLDRLEYHIREELNKTAPRAMVVLNPLKVSIVSIYAPEYFLLCELSCFIFLFLQVVITNLESGSSMDLNAKKWPDAQTEDALYKVIDN